MIPLRIGVFAQRVIITDPNFSSVTLLLHFDGANNSTTFTDSSSFARTVTRSGDAKISTIENKFGGSSGYFDGTGDYLSTSTSSDFGFATGDFTMECWVKTSSNTFVFFDWRTTTHPGVFFHNSTGIGYFEQSGLSVNSNKSINDNAWHHVAFVRASNVLRIFVDGTQYGSSWTITSNHGTSRPMRVGVAYDGSTPFTGYMDDVRITKGVPRYTSNFNIPTTAFPNL